MDFSWWKKGITAFTVIYIYIEGMIEKNKNNFVDNYFFPAEEGGFPPAQKQKIQQSLQKKSPENFSDFIDSWIALSYNRNTVNCRGIVFFGKRRLCCNNYPLQRRIS